MSAIRRAKRAVFRAAAVACALAVLSVTALAAPAYAVPTTHEITADWADSPAPTDAPYGATRTAEFRISTNDASDPYSNDTVQNVRATLTATGGAFSSIPAVCKTTGVTPVSAITAGGTQLLCNLGTITEGTSSIIQAPVRANGATGTSLSVSGTVTSDSAAAPAGPASTSALPITGSHGMDLAISAANAQTITMPSRFGGNRQTIAVDYGLALSAGSIPGPASYSFTLDIAVSVAGQVPGLEWEGCGPVGDDFPAAGIPFSASTHSDGSPVLNRTNVPTCAISGSGTHYTVTLSNLDYSLQHVPTLDSLGTAIPSTTDFIAAGRLSFSYTAPVSTNVGVTFGATPTPFTFSDGVTLPETNTGNDVSGTTLTVPGAFSISWQGGPTVGRAPWDANLYAAPGAARNLTLPWPPAGSSTNPGPYSINDQPLASVADSVVWTGYTGPGGADLAGSCSMVQNPAAFTPRYADYVAADVDYKPMTTAHLWYRTDALDTKTETCGEPVGVAGSPWIALPLPAACATQTTVISPAYSDDPCVADLPAGVTAVKMTWNPAVDKEVHKFLRVWGYVPQTAPIGAESWTVGAFNTPYDPTVVFPGFPALNNYTNISTNSSVIAEIPGSTYGPNTNGIRDGMRIIGPNGVITKTTPDTTARPGVPVTFDLSAESDLAGSNPPAQTFTVTDTLPTGMAYVAGSGSPAPTLSTNGSGQQVLTFAFANVPANTPQPIRYQAQTAANSAIAPGTVLTNVAEIDVPGDVRPAAVRQATASVTVPNSAATTLGKSSEDAVLAFGGDSSAWDLTIGSQDPLSSAFTDTIDVLPYKGDGRGTSIDGSYSIDAVTATGATVYYTGADPTGLSLDPRDPSNGTAPGSVAGNSVGWSTTMPAHVTGIRVIGPALAPGATQRIRIAYSTPAGADCAAPAPTDNKPGQLLVNSATTIAGHTALPMRSSATSAIGDCSAVDVQKYVLRPGGDPTHEADWLDADAAPYPQYAAGETVPYRIVVTNKGTTALTNVVVTDSLLPGCSFTVATLIAGGSVPNQCSGTAAVGTTINTASVSATTPDGGTLTGSDPAGIVVPSPYVISKTASPAGAAAVGDKVTYTIAVSEPLASAAPFPGAAVTDDLSKVLDDADYDGGVTASAGTASVQGGVLTWSIPALVPGQTVLITYSVTVRRAALTTGDQTLTNTVTAAAGQSNCDPGSSDPACTTTTLVPSYTVEKSVDATNASAGDTLTYTVTVRNTGAVAYPATGSGAASFTDSLAGVLDDGTLVGTPTASAGTATVVPGTSDLTWSGPLDVAPNPGATVTITYRVAVNGQGDGDLANSVAATGDDGGCASATACTTHTPVRSYAVSKSATPGVAHPGDQVHYTITVRNTGSGAYTLADPASLTDDLSGVLDDAALVPGSLTASAGTPTIAGTRLTWSGPLDAAMVTIGYTVRVASAPAGDIRLVNTVAPTGPGGICATAADCTTTTLIAEFHVHKTASAPTAIPGDTVQYTIVVDNTGTAPYTATDPASFTDSLVGVLDDAAYQGDVHATGGAAAVAGNQLSWSGALAVGGSVRITYSVVVDAPDHGDLTLRNRVVTPTGAGGNCATGSADPDCEVVVPVRALEVTKTVDRSEVVPGQVVTYTIAVKNIGTVDYPAPSASFTDDLSGVLDDAGYDAGSASATSGTVSYAAPVLSWSGGLAVGATATITYSVTVNDPDTGDVHLGNAVVTPAGSGGNCAPGSTDPVCRADVPGPDLHLTKSVSSAVASPGQKVTYTVRLQNTGDGDFTAAHPASFTDDLSAVLDDATYDGDADHGATYADPVLSWSGPLAAGASITITYSVTVKAGGDGFVDNTVATPPGTTSNCAAGSSDPDCFTRTVIRSFALAKTSDAAAAGDLGQTIHYTITVTNTGDADYTAAEPAGFADDLSGVLDDAVYNGDADNGAAYAAPVLSWSGPLPVGATVTVSYSVTVHAQRTGDGRVYNAVQSTAVGGGYESNCRRGAIASDPACWTLATLPDPPLALTGVDAARTLLGGIAMLLIGALLIVLRRRRRRE